ncbi:hypothetical protein D3C72_1822760 [compost metagenome]
MGIFGFLEFEQVFVQNRQMFTYVGHAVNWRAILARQTRPEVYMSKLTYRQPVSFYFKTKKLLAQAPNPPPKEPERKPSDEDERDHELDHQQVTKSLAANLA